MNKDYLMQLKENSDNVYNQTKEKFEAIISTTVHKNDGTVEASIKSYSLGFTFWLDELGKLNSRPPILWNSLMTVSSTAETSFFLALHGFYKAAFSELRNLLDGFLTKVYFEILNKNNELKDYWIDDSENFIAFKETKAFSDMPSNAKGFTNAYAQWLTGKKYVYRIELYPTLPKQKDFPSKEEVLSVIFDEKNLSVYNKKFQLRKEIDELYLELSKFVHDRPPYFQYKKQVTQSSILNIRFDEADFKKWFECSSKTVETKRPICMSL